MKKTVIGLAFSGLSLMASAASGVRGGVYYVEKGDPQTVSSTIEYSHMEVSDDLTVTTGGQLKKTGTESDVIAPDAGDKVTILIKESGQFTSVADGHSMLFGPGKARIRYTNWQGYSTTIPTIYVSASAQSYNDNGYIDVFESNSQMPTLNPITSSNALPVRITFTGNQRVGMGKWEQTFFRSADASNKFVLESVSGNPIAFGKCQWWPFHLANMDGTVSTAGDGPFVLDKMDGNDTSRANLTRLLLDHTIGWGHKGDFISSNIVVYCSKDYVLPYGAQTGKIVLESRSYDYNDAVSKGKLPYFGMIDLQGTTQAINGLDTCERGLVTNSSSKTAVLQVGTGDLDCSMRGRVDGNLVVEKLGSGRLSLDSCALPALTIREGTVGSVSDDGVVIGGNLDLAPGMTYSVADGETLSVGGLGLALTPVEATSSYYNGNGGNFPKGVMQDSGLLNPAAVQVAAGGDLTVNASKTTLLERMKFDCAGAFHKTGSGDYVIRTAADYPQVFSGLLHAAEGTLSFSGMGITNEWWRLTVEKLTYLALDKAVIQEFGLFDKDGNRVNTGIGLGPTDLEDLSTLENGKVTYSSDLMFRDGVSGSYTLRSMFSGTWYYWLELAGTVSGSVPPSLVFTFRLAKGKNPVHSYTFASQWSGTVPTTWTLETSPDGKNWTTVDEKTNFYQIVQGCEYWWRGDQRWGSNFGLPLTVTYANESAEHASIAGATLRADFGATVDVRGTSGTITGIEVDWERKGGTLRGVQLPSAGTLSIVNAPGKTGLCNVALADLEDVPDCELSGWILTVNGSPSQSRIVVRDGQLHLERRGMTVIVR